MGNLLLGLAKTWNAYSHLELKLTFKHLLTPILSTEMEFTHKCTFRLSYEVCGYNISSISFPSLTGVRAARNLHSWFGNRPVASLGVLAKQAD